MEAPQKLKPDRNFVLDIPNIAIHALRIRIRTGEYHGRTGKFEMNLQAFAELLRRNFSIEKAGGGAMLKSI